MNRQDICILSIDQSTQGTKALVFDSSGKLKARAYKSHRQLVNEKGWVEHNPEELLSNVAEVCREAISKADVSSSSIAAVGITNQRETTLMWNRVTGKPIANAGVWQCSRAKEICQRKEIASFGERIKSRTGLTLSPFFPAAKAAWLMENIPEARELSENGRLCCGTIDSWLIYSLTEERNFFTDVSNASRTQLFNIRTLQWDNGRCVRRRHISRNIR